MILMNAKKFLSYITVMCVVISIGMLVCCKSNDSADLMVYGKIFTSEGGQIVEAFAVKDGKYVYVGDKAGAEAYIEEGKTEVVDYTGKGLVMPLLWQCPCTLFAGLCHPVGRYSHGQSRRCG